MWHHIQTPVSQKETGVFYMHSSASIDIEAVWSEFQGSAAASDGVRGIG